MEVVLKLHECYYPFIKVFKTIRIDKTGKHYWRACYQNFDLQKIGFVIREDLFEKLSLKKIAEVRLKVKEKGGICTIEVSNYYTFSDLQKDKRYQFYEVEGVFVSGIYTIANSTGEHDQIMFIPSLPNRFSFNDFYSK